MNEETTIQEKKVDETFLNERIFKGLGVTPELNEIELRYYDEHRNLHLPRKEQIFSADDAGNIRILPFTLKREYIQYLDENANPDAPSVANGRIKEFFITRLKEPQIVTDKEGNERVKKYDIPAKAGTYPFFPPLLLDMFEKKTKCKTLILTEGYIKSFKGAMHGIPVVGLSSITHYRRKDTEKMYDDILLFIEVCQVEHVIVLHDGDCRDISLKALENGKSLDTRPRGFIKAAQTVRDLLNDCNVKTHYAFIETGNLEHESKGLDDLLQDYPEDIETIVDEATQLNGKQKYFWKENITNNLVKVYNKFHLNKPDNFYLFHQEKIGLRKFLFSGTEYIYNENKGKCEVGKPAAADDYFRVGDNYYQWVYVPDVNGDIIKKFAPRIKTTISDDHGKSIFNHIPKYTDFCNVPNHESFTQVINNCFNLYYEFSFIPEKGDYSTSLAFMKHIFGEQVEMGLDYVQLLYKRPTQILPILCLVSVENQTGKSTFIKWMKEIFGENSTTVGNQDFSGDFNFHWASKLLIMCEESLIDKRPVVEKIKALSTATKTSMNRKGKDQSEVPFFGKFILASNNEDSFIIANKQDIRYWVRKVPVIPQKDPHFEEKLFNEIPAFLDFLGKRTMTVSKPKSRMWFDEMSIRTEAFDKLVQNNTPTIIKLIENFIRNLFIDFDSVHFYHGEPCVMMTRTFIHEVVLNKRYDKTYLDKILNEMKHEPFLNSKNKKIATRFKIPSWGTDVTGEPEIHYNSYAGKVLIFKAKDYFNELEFEQMGLDKLTDSSD